MKKERIEITKSNNYIHFYYVCADQRHLMFSQVFSQSVYKYFRYGRSVNEVLSYNGWDRNPRLEKTLERLPYMISYIRKEYQLPGGSGKRKSEHFYS